MVCQICDGQLSNFASYGKYQVYKCESCGFGQTNVTADDIRNFYDVDYFSGGKARFSQKPEDKIDDGKKWWVDKFIRGETISCLEIGPGPAAMIAAYLLETRSQVSYEAVEVSRDASDQLRRRALRVHTGRIYDDAISCEIAGRFDYVVATEVIEHDLEPRNFISGLFKALKTGGHACLTTGNFDGLTARVKGTSWYYLDPPAHVVFYTPKSVRLLFSEAGFRKVSIHCVGLNYVRLYKKFPLPGFLHLIDLLQVPTGMTIYAER